MSLHSLRLWAVVAAVVAIVAAGGVAANRKKMSELPVHVATAERMLASQPIYLADDPNPFTYPPFMALAFLPIQLLPESCHRTVWYVVNVAATGLVLWLLHGMISLVRPPGSDKRGLTVCWLIVLVLGGRYLSSVFENQSNDLLVCTTVALAAVAFARGQDAESGLWAGVGAALKATPLLFGLLFVLRRNWRATVWATVAGLGLTLLPDLILPQGNGRLWVVSWFETFLTGLSPGAPADSGMAWSAGSLLNQSLSATIHRLLTPVQETSHFVRNVVLFDAGPAGRKMVLLGAQFAVLVLLAVAVWPARREDNDVPAAFRRFGVASAIACGMVLLSPMSSKAHFCVLLLPLVFCAADYVFVQRDRVVMSFLAAICMLGLLTMKGLVGRAVGNTLLAYGVVTWTALAALACTAYVLRRRAVAPALRSS